jgi:hypothetical protein
MNIVNVKIKKRDEFSWYKTSHHRMQLKVCVRNMSKEQCDKLEKAMHKICRDILPDKDSEEK